jgi:hypothetical protein
MITPLMNDPFFDDVFIFYDDDDEDNNFIFSNEFENLEESSSDSWRIMIVDDRVTISA